MRAASMIGVLVWMYYSFDPAVRRRADAGLGIGVWSRHSAGARRGAGEGGRGSRSPHSVSLLAEGCNQRIMPSRLRMPLRRWKRRRSTKYPSAPMAIRAQVGRLSLPGLSPRQKSRAAIEIRASRSRATFPKLSPSWRNSRPTQFVLDGEIVISTGNRLSFNDLLDADPSGRQPHQETGRRNAGHVHRFRFAGGHRWPAHSTAARRAAASARKIRQARVRPRRAHRAFARHARYESGPPLVRRGRQGARRHHRQARRFEYRSADRTGMQKIKRQQTADCVVGGFRYASKGRLVGSLLLGLYDDDGLLHHVGFTSNIARSEKAALTRKLEKLIDRPVSPATRRADRAAGAPKRSTEWEPLKPNSSSKSNTTISPAAASATARVSCAGGPTRRRGNAKWNKSKTAAPGQSNCCAKQPGLVDESVGRGQPRLRRGFKMAARSGDSGKPPAEPGAESVPSTRRIPTASCWRRNVSGPKSNRVAAGASHRPHRPASECCATRRRRSAGRSRTARGWRASPERARSRVTMPTKIERVGRRDDLPDCSAGSSRNCRSRSTASPSANCSPATPPTNRPPRISPRISSRRYTRSQLTPRRGERLARQQIAEHHAVAIQQQPRPALGTLLVRQRLHERRELRPAAAVRIRCAGDAALRRARDAGAPTRARVSTIVARTAAKPSDVTRPSAASSRSASSNCDGNSCVAASRSSKNSAP